MRGLLEQKVLSPDAPVPLHAGGGRVDLLLVRVREMGSCHLRVGQ